MLFPITSSKFWKQIRTTSDEVVTKNLSQQLPLATNLHLPEKTLLEAIDVYKIFDVSRLTLYYWSKELKRLCLKKIKDQIISKVLN